MRILIASDLHGSVPALNFLQQKALELHPDLLILLGDLVYHGPRNPLPGGYNTRHILDEMPDFLNLACPITAVRGNCDAEVDVDLLPFKMPESAWINVDGLRIFACHGHHLPEHAPIPELPPNTIVLRGHTHIPRGETELGISFWNPGSLALPKGGFPQSYGVYENGIFKVLDTSGNQILEHRPNL